MQRSVGLAFALSLFSPAIWAQAEVPSKPLLQEPWQVGIGTAPVAGDRDGTLRYNVTFKARSFDVEAFRRAVEAHESAAVVGDIVHDLEQRARTEQEPFRKTIEALGGGIRIQFWLINACNIEIPPAQLAAVRAMPNVLAIDPDLPTYPLTFGARPMIKIKVSTDVNHHNADGEQAIGNKGNGASVAIVDTSQNDNLHGVNMPHMGYYRNADRTNHTGGGMDGSRLLANVQKGSQPANNSAAHGSGVAGIAAGAGWLTPGQDQGHASDAGIVGYSICDVAGSCNSTLAIEAAGWQQVAADKVLYNIVAANMSYGSSPNVTDVSQQAIDACAINANVLPCTAAGNSGPGSGSTTGSSSTCNGLAVAAIDPSNKTVAGFSSRGPISDGGGTRIFPDIAGCGVNTVMPQWGNESADFVASGTSMATPQVTGAAGLVRSA
ncbi:MAG TPA: S8 family serine peptidase, partial [Planctomycetota bacterium]|nr:S8 family serine peptidase [Planctomycetota bacterium]